MILGINIDHIATLRNARSEGYPNLLDLALIAVDAGANQITAHLREDRRHIKDDDITSLKANLPVPLNMEMALTEEMVTIALKTKPYAVCLVPEKRNEITTEGGLDLITNAKRLKVIIPKLQNAGIKVSLFIDSMKEQLDAAYELKCNSIEINTGAYANASGNNIELEITKIQKIAQNAKLYGLGVHAGHGLNFKNIPPIAKIPEITEFNIGHFLVSYALFVGFKNSVSEMCKIITSYKS